MLSFTIGKSSMSIFLDGKFYSIDDSHPNYTLIRTELAKPAAERDVDSIRENISVREFVVRATHGKVVVSDGLITYDGAPVDNYMTRRMLDLLVEGFDIDPWVRFMDNVCANPAGYVRDELYEWMEKAEMPITPDGCFLAFKKVRKDYTDCHTGKFDHSPGSIIEMDRDMCDPNRHNHCSTGFHFCSVNYLSSFGGERVVIVKINPADVTSIPSDYDFTKGRCCRYEVVAELTKQSAAYDKCWRKGVVNLESPAEFPEGVLSQIKLPAPALNEPAEAGLGLRDVPENRAVEVAAAQIEEEMTDAEKADVLVLDETFEIEEEWDFESPTEADFAPEPAEETFTTAGGRTFSVTEIRQALDDASIRAAARVLGIAESTLRGWKKKLGL